MDFGSLFSIPIGDLILWFVVFVFSLSFHEMAHAWTSERFGDDTGRMQGRISLNPLVHIDPIGTILFPLMGFLRANGLIFFGWAKPVETNPLRWRNKDVANISVAAAGPISNFILAAVAFIALRLMLTSGSFVPGGYGPYDLISPAVADAGVMTPVATMISMMLLTNVSLGVFNLIPIPPLDGSHVLETLLPASLAEAYGQLRQFGWILLIGLSMLGVFRLVLLPVITFVVRQLYS